MSGPWPPATVHEYQPVGLPRYKTRTLSWIALVKETNKEVMVKMHKALIQITQITVQGMKSLIRRGLSVDKHREHIYKKHICMTGL